VLNVPIFADQIVCGGAMRSPGGRQALKVDDVFGEERFYLLTELFGHRPDAFTSAIDDQKDPFNAAAGGSIKIGEMGSVLKIQRIARKKGRDMRVMRNVTESFARTHTVTEKETQG
jgi:hypothetical protein